MKRGQTTQPKNTGDLLLHNLPQSITCCEGAVARRTAPRSILQMNPEEAVRTQLVFKIGCKTFIRNNPIKWSQSYNIIEALEDLKWERDLPEQVLCL